MAALWQDSLPAVVSVANHHYSKGRFAPASTGYELAARLARQAQLDDYETSMLNAAWYCHERASGYLPKEAW